MYIHRVLSTGIGDEHRLVGMEEGFPQGAAESTGAECDIPFDKEFIRMAESSKFEGDVCEQLAAESLSPEELAVAKHKQGAPLTASEVQALGDMALQSAVSVCCVCVDRPSWWLLVLLR